MPIYLVSADSVAHPARLIRAPNKAAASRYLAREFTIEVASQTAPDALLRLVEAGVTVEDTAPEELA